MIRAHAAPNSTAASFRRPLAGMEAGLLGGLFIIVLFFLLDLIRLTPLSTPIMLSTGVWGPDRVNLDLPMVSEAITVGGFAGQVLAFTLLHFLVFALLGLGLVYSSGALRLPVNVATGAVYGLLVCSLVFFGSMALMNGTVLSVGPGPLSVVGANLLAGGIMGAYIQWRTGSHGESVEAGSLGKAPPS